MPHRLLLIIRKKRVTMLEAINITKSFSNSSSMFSENVVNAVKNVNLKLESGKFYALVGESGSGKSTLSRLLTGLIQPTSGEIRLNGETISSGKIKMNDSLRRRIQLVLQDGKSALDPHMNIYDCIAEPIRNFKLMARQDEVHRINELMNQMELPLDILKRKPHELSGGQQKRVCIARALAAKPEMIIFDESVSGLDVIVRKSILDLLLRLHAEQNSIYLFITHDMDVALYLANYISVMKDGVIIETVHYTGDSSCFTHPYSNLLLSSMFAH